MFIQTEATPNPESLKFIPGVSVSKIGPKNYAKANNCDDSGLAKKLLNIENVENVFFGSDFITITKSANITWELLKPEILVTIMDYVISGMPIIESSDNNKPLDDDNDSTIVKEIKDIIETRVRPAVAQDGGDITFVEFTAEGVVKVELQGACSGCPSSSVTLKNGIENMLKHYVPEVTAVEAI